MDINKLIIAGIFFGVVIFLFFQEKDIALFIFGLICAILAWIFRKKAKKNKK